MTTYSEAEQIKQIVEKASKIVIIQADNPDADSLGSALALEHIIGDMGKEPVLYCAVDMPTYLRYMPGWDRIQSDVPNSFDASIIVDASTMTLFERLQNSGQQAQLATKPCVVLDHHQIVENPVPFASVVINDHTRASAGELICMLSKQLAWQVSVEAQELLMNSILGDTQGLSNQLASAETYRIMAEFVDNGVDRPQLEEIRRQYSKMPQEIFSYKADLIKRTGFSHNGKLALVVIPQAEINKYSPLYNPAPLIQNDMLQTLDVQIAVVLKSYTDGRVTAAIRSNAVAPIAADLADHFGGGGHKHASGFKVTDGRVIEEIKSECIREAGKLLEALDETV